MNTLTDLLLDVGQPRVSHFPDLCTLLYTYLSTLDYWTKIVYYLFTQTSPVAHTSALTPTYIKSQKLPNWPISKELGLGRMLLPHWKLLFICKVRMYKCCIYFVNTFLNTNVVLLCLNCDWNFMFQVQCFHSTMSDVNWTPRNKLHWNFNQNSYIFNEENQFENDSWKMAAILSRSQCVNNRGPHNLWTTAAQQRYMKHLNERLTHWGWDKMADISQTTFSNAFSWMKMCKFRFTVCSQGSN